jgi:hypothetical protein
MVAINVCGKKSLIFSKVKSVVYMFPLQKYIFCPYEGRSQEVGKSKFGHYEIQLSTILYIINALY